MMILWPASKKKIERIKENLVHLNFFYYSSPNDDESITIQVSPSFVAKKKQKKSITFNDLVFFQFNFNQSFSCLFVQMTMTIKH